MNDKSKQRRRLLRALGACGGVAAAVPDTWVRPMVDSVLLPSHAQTTGRELNCEITRGEEGASPRVSGATFFIDTIIEFFDPEISAGDTLDARHRVPDTEFDQTFPSTVTQSLDRFFGTSGIPFSIPLPLGVAAGQELVITVTMTSGELSGLSCTGALDIE